LADKNNWFNNGPNIDAGYFQIVSTELDETNDYKLIALVPDNDEKTATLIVHTPEMLEILTVLTALNKHVKQFGESDFTERNFKETFFRAEQLLCDFE